MAIFNQILKTYSAEAIEKICLDAGADDVVSKCSEPDGRR